MMTVQQILKTYPSRKEYMSDGDFELNKLGWYTVQAVEPNDFINKGLESDQYGIYYSVKFTGDADTFLWQAKTAPEAGQKVYGHLEKAKSGKSVKFRRAKKEDTPQESASITPGVAPKNSQSTDESIARAVALKAAVEFLASANQHNNNVEHTIDIADQFLAWLQGDVQKPVETGDKAPARDWTKVGKPKDEDMDAVDTYKKHAEPLPDYPGDY